MVPGKLVMSSPCRRLVPKSAILATAPAKRMLLGFKSRCRISCACKKASPHATCRATSTKVAAGHRLTLPASSRDSRVLPATCSITSISRASDADIDHPNRRTMFGCGPSRSSRAADLRKETIPSGVRCFGCSVLIATRWTHAGLIASAPFARSAGTLTFSASTLSELRCHLPSDTSPKDPRPRVDNRISSFGSMRARTSSGSSNSGRNASVSSSVNEGLTRQMSILNLSLDALPEQPFFLPRAGAAAGAQEELSPSGVDATMGASASASASASAAFGCWKHCRIASCAEPAMRSLSRAARSLAW
mmetsp:Transcript_70393/g.139533  ORF Transcript_70393/g.139533 Transcript_70393/m.139533 type:complete len:305 (+) Transcript_70393:593-1507(+)